MMYQNVAVPEVRAKFGGGYVGAQAGARRASALGAEAVRLFGLKATGDEAIVVARLDRRNERVIRELGTLRVRSKTPA